jgi:hypothetical protein
MTRDPSSADNAVPAGELEQVTELGQVDPPGEAVLEAAREALWSAVAQEVLRAAPAGDSGARHRPAQPRTGDVAREPDAGQ